MSNSTSASPQKPEPRKKNGWARLLLFLITLVATLLVLTPTLMKQGLQHWLSEQTKSEVTIADIRLDLFQGKLILQQLRIPHRSTSGEAAATSLEYASVTLDWQALFNKQLVIKEITISHADISIKRSDNKLQLAGFSIPETAASETKTEIPNNAPLPALTIETITLESIWFDYHSNDLSTRAGIIDATIQNFTTEATNEVLINLTAGIDTGRIQFQGGLRPFAKAPTFGGTFTITELDLVPFVVLVPQTDFVINGATLSLHSTINGTLTHNTPVSINLTGRAALNGIDIVSTLHPETFFKTTVIEFNHIEIAHPEIISAGEITLRDLNTSLFLNQAGQLLTSQTSTSQQPDEAEQNPVNEENNKTSQPGFNIDRLLLTGNNALVFKDASVEPTFELKLRSLILDVGQIDSRAKTAETPINLNARLNSNGTLQLKGNVAPLRDDITLKIENHLSGLELPTLSPYTEKHIGYQLRRGRLAADTTLTITNGQLQASNQLTLSKLSLRESNHEKAQGLIEQLEMPLDSALDMLRDGDDNIVFDLPIDGALDDPQFKLDGVIKLALGKGMKMAAMNYLTNALQPLGTLLLAKNIVDHVTQMRFKPLVFPPGSAELNEHSLAYLNKIGTLLNQRPNLNITLCGIATGDDSAATGETEAPVEQAMQMLASTRSDSARNHLITRQGVQPSQLFECAPEVTSDREGDTDTPATTVEGIEIIL